jgi:hypothetical protein
VEVLVAAAIISLSAIAIVAVVRKGREIDVNDLHRRTARAIICAKLDSRLYSYSNYANLSAGTTTETDTLDYRLSGGSVLTGTLTKTITGPVTKATNNGLNVDGIIINMRMIWSEAGYSDSLKIEKWIANVL